MQKSTYPKGNVIEGHHDIFEKQYRMKIKSMKLKICKYYSNG